jgi:hypothetical protein
MVAQGSSIQRSRNNTLVPFGSRWACLGTAMAIVLACTTPAMAAPCGNVSLSFFDHAPAGTPFINAGEPAQHLSAQLQFLDDGTRLLRSPYWSVGYRVSPHGTGESYWAEGTNSPMLDIEFQRDTNGRVVREILRSPPRTNAALPGNPWRILGWYQYDRNFMGQLSQLVYYSNMGPDGQWLTEDDQVSSRVEIDYGLGGARPREATIFYVGSRVPIRFDYDTSGRLTGGVWQAGAWASRFSVTSGSCEAVPERLFVLLLSAQGGPWNPFYGTRRLGIRPNGPR